MNLAPAERVCWAAEASSGIRVVPEVAGLGALEEPQVTIVQLRRTLSLALLGEVATLMKRPHVNHLLAVQPASAHECLRSALDGLSVLSDDLAFWVEVVSDLTGCQKVGVRLSRVTSAMCPRFHVDHVVVRLVCTYVGPATEFVGTHDVARAQLGKHRHGLSDEASGLLSAEARVLRAQTGDVVLLKGEAWPHNEGRGAVHRSPAVEAGRARLVLTLDPL
jgi:Protein of unknown function (DUF1826)